MKHSSLVFSLIAFSLTEIGMAQMQVGKLEWIAHRGESYLAPENTLAAFNLAWEQGTDVVELDVHLTKDGRPICIHDADTERIAGQKLLVKEHNLSELQKLDAGSWKDARWAGEKMPTLQEAIATIPQSKRMFIEVKVGPEAVPELVRAIKQSQKGPEQLVVMSFKAETIAEAKLHLPLLRMYCLSSLKQDEKTGQWTPTVDELIRTAREIGADGLNVQANEPVNEHFVSRVRDAGLELYVWTIDDPEPAKRMIALGVDGIASNRPAWLREQVAAP